MSSYITWVGKFKSTRNTTALLINLCSLHTQSRVAKCLTALAKCFGVSWRIYLRPHCGLATSAICYKRWRHPPTASLENNSLKNSRPGRDSISCAFTGNSVAESPGRRLNRLLRHFRLCNPSFARRETHKKGADLAFALIDDGFAGNLPMMHRAPKHRLFGRSRFANPTIRVEENNSTPVKTRPA